MGTRHLIMAVVDGETKIAQYGQWDGYPSGQGVDVLEFLQQTDMNGFRASLRKCRFATDEELEGKTLIDYPQMSRDHGAGILKLVLDGCSILKDSSSFAKDGLFCEYVYTLNMDEERLEISGDPFGEKVYAFDDMPDKARFLAELEPTDDD